ncbi:MAG: cytochrome c3 family protein [Pseudomonadota bacterium]|nr:cytochrome c3 family protein [Pseudomonadota bacterium]
MTFKLRQIDYTADGRRIARDRMVERDTLRVGRAGDNDIHLPDLAVEPYHAVIEATGSGTDGTRLTVQSAGTRSFLVDGRAVKEARIDAGTGAELGFGVTTITVSRDGDGMVLLEIQSHTKQEKPDPATDKAGFSLARAMPGKRAIGWGLLTLILLLFLVLPIASHLSHAAGQNGHVPGNVIGDKAWNPGELSLAHHALSTHCEACHVKPFQAVRNETCMSCHKDVHDHAPAAMLAMARGPAGFGAAALQGVAHAFGREGPGACVDCHVEHQGMRTMEPTRQQFCADCHGSLKDLVHGTKLGNAGDFGTAHPEFRAWIVTNAETRARAPVSLDDHPREDDGLTFSHRMHLDRMGGVAKMAMTLGSGQGYGHALGCADCHRPSSDGTRFEPVSMERDCEACHSLAYSRVGGTYLKLRHGDVPQMLAQLSLVGPARTMAPTRTRPGDFAPNYNTNYSTGRLYHANFALSGVAGRAMAPNGICGECHKPEMRGGRLAVRPVTLVSRYMPNGWFDHAAHSQTRCSECHAAATSQSSTDVLLPRVAECRSCHMGEAAAKPRVPSSCAMCHAYHKSALAPVSARRMKRGDTDGALPESERRLSPAMIH